ncbi:MAG: hypothetical protein ACYDEX_15310 [Mobilitalea sp.]
MKVIKQRMRILLIPTGFCIILSVFSFIQSGTWIIVNTFSLLAIIGTGFSLGFMAWYYKKLKSIMLIVDNSIMHILPAQIMVDIPRKKGESYQIITGIEVFISCFGILVDSKVIKFNHDGIHLLGVEIENEFITLTYGTKERKENIRIIHEKINKEEMKSIIERFRYETGITPVILD